jgi:hypothetical protein
VFDTGEAGALGYVHCPALDDLGIDRLTPQAAAADEVVAMSGGRPLPVEPATTLIAYYVDASRAFQFMECAVDGGQADGHSDSRQPGVQILGGHEISALAERVQYCGALPRPAQADRGRTGLLRTLRPCVTHCGPLGQQAPY